MKRGVLILGLMILLWLVLAWEHAGLEADQRLGMSVTEARTAAEARVDSIRRMMEQGISNLDGIAVYIAQEADVRTALQARPALPDSATPAQRKARWSADRTLAGVNRHLEGAARHLGVDVIFVLDAQGNTIASSNHASETSFVGGNYSDREYFRAALAGQPGRQYAMGRLTNIPGLYFSAPVRQGASVVGVVTVKIDLPRLAYWVGQADVLVADEYGVVILSSDPSLEMSALPGARVADLPPERRLARYKRREFREMRQRPWPDARFPGVILLDDRPTPYLIARSRLAALDFALDVRVAVPDLAQRNAPRMQDFLLVGVGGALLLLVVGGSLLFALQRRRAERRAAASLSLHKAILEATSDGILVVDLSRNLSAWNQRFADLWRIPEGMLGNPDEDLLLRHVLDQLRDPDGFLARVEELYQRPEESAFELLEFKDGRVFERHSHPQRLDGRVVGRVWSFRDITLRNRALEKLAQSELELQTIIESEPECVKVLDEQGRLLQMNRAGLDMIQAATLEEVRGQSVEALVVPEHRAAFRALGERIFRGESGVLEFEIVGLQGRHRQVDTHAVPLRAPDGAVRALLAVTRDVTEHKAALRHLYLVDYALDHVSEAAYLVDRAGRLQYVNAEACRALGYPREELLKLAVADVDANTSPDAWENSWEMIAARSALTLETAHRRRDGTIFPVEVSISHFEFDGRAYALGLARDIAERRAAQAERDQLQRQLQHAQKLEAIGQLTGGIAHDFNNILGAILGFTGLILDRYADEVPAKARDYLKEVQKAGERARDLIQKMLAFARGGAGDVQVLDPRPLTREVIKMLVSTLPSSLELREDIAPETRGVRIDPVQFHQIVTNLIINARDATGGQGRITIGLRETLLSGEVCQICHQPVRGDFIELYVRDDGEGIAPEVMPKIFDPFFTTKDVGKGSGMGLAMVLGILREHGGHILVESRPGEGALFRVFFHPAQGHAPETTAPARITGGPATCGRHVLVVDDEISLGQLMGEVLEANGYCASIHGNPRAALEAFRADPRAFDAVITDQTMPGLTGLDLVREMLALRPELPVIMVSGYSDKVDAESASRHGIRRFFYKPVEAADLLAALREHLV